jgi:hypothetical protein
MPSRTCLALTNEFTVAFAFNYWPSVPRLSAIFTANPPRFAPLVSCRGRHVCQVLLKLHLLLRRGILGVSRLDRGIHGVQILLLLHSVHFVDVPDLIIEVRGRGR